MTGLVRSLQPSETWERWVWPAWLVRHRPPSPRRAIAACQDAPPSVQRQDFGTPCSHDTLVRAYAASLLDLALKAEALQASSDPLRIAPTALQDLIVQTVDTLGPMAARAGLRLYRDPLAAELRLWPTDVARRRAVLNHLLLRALMGEPAPGHVRVTMAVACTEASISVLARAPELAPQPRTSGSRSELAMVACLLKPLGGELAFQPRRAGYLPLSLLLRRAPSCATRLAA